MRTAVLSTLRVLALLLFAATAAAQSSNDPAGVVAELRHGVENVKSSYEFFHRQSSGKQPASSEEAIADNFQKLKESAEILQRLAPQATIDLAYRRALSSTQGAFRAAQLPVPSTLTEAVAECERRRDDKLAARVAGDIAAPLDGARAHIEAEMAFGPIVDNPELYGSITPPTNPTELLRNLKFALDHDAVLRPDFFTAENLERFFGVKVAVDRGPGRSIRARWVDNRHEGEPATLEQVFSQCQYILGHDQTSSGRKSGGIRIGCNFKHVGGPTFEEVEDVFGNEWRNGWVSSPPPLHGVPARPTAPNGNAWMIYNFDKESLGRSIEVSFGPNAQFRSFTLDEEER